MFLFLLNALLNAFSRCIDHESFKRFLRHAHHLVVDILDMLFRSDLFGLQCILPPFLLRECSLPCSFLSLRRGRLKAKTARLVVVKGIPASMLFKDEVSLDRVNCKLILLT